MSNIYWPIYKNLESEVIKLSYSIHINEQHKFYSSNISDIILRAATEIDSISKDLYLKYIGTKIENVNFELGALQNINELWKLDKKNVMLRLFNSVLTNNVIKPFEKNEKSDFNGNMTYSWNNSYQNLKRDRSTSVVFGNNRYMFDIMAALFLLNIYYKDETFSYNNENNKTNFAVNLGSDLFSIKIHKYEVYEEGLKYKKNNDFDECVYLIRATDESIKKTKNENEARKNKMTDLFRQHPKFIEFINENDPLDYKGNNIYWDVLGQADYINLTQQAIKDEHKNITSYEYEALINKNDI